SLADVWFLQFPREMLELARRLTGLVMAVPAGVGITPAFSFMEILHLVVRNPGNRSGMGTFPRGVHTILPPTDNTFIYRSLSRNPNLGFFGVFPSFCFYPGWFRPTGGTWPSLKSNPCASPVIPARFIRLSFWGCKLFDQSPS